MDEQLGLRLWNLVNQLEGQLGNINATLQQMNELGPRDWLGAGVTLLAYVLGHFQATRSAKKQAAQIELHRLQDRQRKRRESRNRLVEHVQDICAQNQVVSLNCQTLFPSKDTNWESLLDDYDAKVSAVANRKFLIDTCELEFEEKITDLQDAINDLFRAVVIRPLWDDYQVGTIEWIQALKTNLRKWDYARDHFIKLLDDALAAEQAKIRELKKHL
ncbi:MAG: hypothetical protein Sw1PiTSA_14620 [Shewanella algae]|uniref:hypothetical protein n=1 Tax=Shewanella algae TaxID=38313 RepID=UPI0031F55B9F